MLTIYPKMYNGSEPKTSHGSRFLSNGSIPPVLYPNQSKNISFGDDDSNHYTYRDTFWQMRYGNKKVNLQGDTPQNTFQKLYQIIVNDLNIARQKATGNDDVESLLVSDSKYVGAMTGFVKENGDPTKLNSISSAIENHIINRVGLPKPKWYEIFKHTQYSELKGLMDGTCDLIKDGLIKLSRWA